MKILAKIFLMAWLASLMQYGLADDIKQSQKFKQTCPSRPIYPADAIAQKLEGKTTIEVLLNSESQVLDVRIKKSSGIKSFDDASLVNVKTCKFVLLIREGETTPTWVTTTYHWRLD